MKIKMKENIGDGNIIIPKHIALQSKNNPIIIPTRKAVGQQSVTQERIRATQLIGAAKAYILKYN